MSRDRLKSDHYTLINVRQGIITERSRAENKADKQLSHSEERYRCLIELLPEAIVVHRNGKFLYINQVGAKLLGAEHGRDLIGMPIRKVVHPDDWERILCQTELSIDNIGKTFSCEERLLRLDGSVFDAEISSSAFIYEGKPAIQLVMRDLTERNRMAKSLSNSEERYRSLFENNLSGIFSLDLSGHFLSMNPAAERMCGYSREELYLTSFTRLIPSEDQELVMKQFYDVLDGNPTTFEISIIHKNGHRVYLSALGVPMVVNGEVVGIYGITKDISEKKRVKKIFNDITNGVSEEIGEAFFHSLVLKISKSLDVEYAFICEYSESGHMKTIAVSINGQLAENFSYDLLNSPCEITLNSVICCFPNGVADHFPLDTQLRDWQIESYVGVPLSDSDGRKIGLLAIMSKKEIMDLHLAESVLKIFSARAAAELSRKRAEAAVSYLAYHDALTCLPNRYYIHKCLEMALKNAKASDKKVALFYCDLDRFKNINDSMGHSFGDLILQDAVNRLQSVISGTTTLARMGGDAFCLLLPEIDGQEEVIHVAQTVSQLFREPFTVNGHEVYLTLSMGISLYPSDGEDADFLIKNADTAMYRAKELGRNNYQFYNPMMNEAVLDNFLLEVHLRKAIEKEEFKLVYQPQVDMVNKQMMGMEALIRWQHPTLGTVSPGEFIPLAEETGLIIPIGEWVLRKACAENKALQDAGYPVVKVSVNISVRQFQQKNLVQVIEDILQETGLDASYLKLEITESISMFHVDNVLSQLNHLKSIGVDVSIDDFGKGYSSLIYLRRFPISSLKIDQLFITDITSNADSESITRAIISMAHSLKLKVVAEGIETVEQMRFLEALNCDYGQGYLFSRPVPASELKKILESPVFPNYFCTL